MRCDVVEKAWNELQRRLPRSPKKALRRARGQRSRAIFEELGEVLVSLAHRPRRDVGPPHVLAVCPRRPRPRGSETDNFVAGPVVRARIQQSATDPARKRDAYRVPDELPPR